MTIVDPRPATTVLPDPSRRRRAAHAVRPAERTRHTDPSLPTPPSDEEKYAYLQPQWRTLVAVQTAVSVITSTVLTVFFLQHPVLTPFVLVTTLNLVYVLVSFATGMRRRRVGLADHVLRVASWRPVRYPSVDVFLPSAGEPLDVLENTFRHVAALSWPGRLTVLVLDDSARPEVGLLAMQNVFEYRTRPDRGRLKKAGNLLFGYERSSGELIAIFDADFCPRPDFLHELVP